MNEIRLLRADEIEVKVKKVLSSGVIALIYKTARVDMSILDETFGAINWTNDYKEIKGNLYCGIGVKKEGDKEFVFKWDCGTESREDDEGNEKKGEASDAFKRAGFKWGIGRELYTSPFIFIKVETEQQNGKYKLKDDRQRFNVSQIEYDEKRNIVGLKITDQHGKCVYTFKEKQLEQTPEEIPISPPTQIPQTTDIKQRLINIIAGTPLADGKFLAGYIQKRFAKKTANELSEAEYLDTKSAVLKELEVLKNGTKD